MAELGDRLRADLLLHNGIVETVAYQARAAATKRPCGPHPCVDEFPGMPSRWCSGCLIAVLLQRLEPQGRHVHAECPFCLCEPSSKSVVRSDVGRLPAPACRHTYWDLGRCASCLKTQSEIDDDERPRER